MRPILTLAATVTLLLAATPSSAQADALEECWENSASRVELGDCLRTLKDTVDDELSETYVQARNAQAEVDGFVGQRQASRTIDRAQKAFELYRDLDCHLRELQAGSGTGSGDFHLGCWIDMTRARIERLRGLLPEEQGTASPFATWTVTAIAGAKPLKGTQLSLTFEDEAKVSGDGGCNRFFGPVKFDMPIGKEGRVEIGPLGATRKACGDMIDDQETRFLAALGRAQRFAIEGDSLMLTGPDGALIARLLRLD